MRLQGAIGGWAAALFVLISSLRPVSAAVPPSDGDPLFEWKQGWVESPQWGGRLGYINGQGDLKVRLRSGPAGSWVTVARHVRSFQLLDWSLAVLGNDGTLFAAEGALNEPLDPVAENVCAFQKTLTRLGILQCDGTLLVKETVASQPRAVAAGIEAFQILDDRVALRGADGSLWVQEGGVAANFHKLADRVTSFQLEKGWIAYLEPQAAAGAAAAPARLMIAEGSLLIGSAVTAREVARDVMDFEMEVQVEADASFRKTLYLAVLSRDGVLKIGVGRSLPAELKEFDRGTFCSLGWAGGRLAYLGADGLKVAHFGATNWPESLDSFPGAISSFRMTREGTLLFDGDRGSSKLLDWRQASEDAEPAAQTREDGRVVSLIADASGELAVDAAPADVPGGVESSSIRPHFMRRPVQATLASSGSRALPVRLFSNVPRARAVDAGSPRASSAAAGASNTAPEASSAAKVSDVLPLSQSTAVPLYRLYYPDGTDHFYTTNASERDYAKSLGYLDQGVAAYVEPAQVAGTLPFQRFYMGPPRSDHFYTTDAGEAQLVRNFGFIPEGIEGYLYTTQVGGSVPLHRLSWCGGGSSDCDHFYTIDPAERDQVLTWGWGYDGVAGYVWSVASTPAGPNGAAFVSQSVPASMVLGQTYRVSITMRNSGANTWSAAAAYRLGSQNPPDNLIWGIGRVEVQFPFEFGAPPGVQVVFTFNVTPSRLGSLNFQWRMVQDGVEWFGDLTPNVPVAVSPPSGAPNGAVFVSESVPGNMILGQSYPVSVTMRNSGTNIWSTAAAYRLGSQNPPDNFTWGIGRVDVPYDVPPGGVVTFAFNVTPSGLGSLNFQWRMLQEGIEWFGDFTPNVPVIVSPASGADDAAFVSQSIPGLMTVRQSSTVSITMRNTGPTTWTQGTGYQLSSQNPQDNRTWGVSRVDLPSDVAPNATVTFTVAATPAAAGLLPFQWRMVHGGSVFGAATQNVLIVVARNPRFPVGATPYADNYISNFYSLQGWVPDQTSVRWKPYTGNECPTPYLTTSACNPGIPAWARENRPNPPINPCLAHLMVTENFLAPHARRNIGPDPNGVTWTPVGKSTYGPINWYPCDVSVLQITGFCHAPTKLLFWLVEADPVLAVGNGAYCPTDQKSTTRYSQGSLSREILPGEVTPDSYAMVPSWAPNFAQGGVQANPWRAYVPAGHKVVANDQIAGKGDVFWINVPPAGTSIPVLGATLFGGGFSGPQCFVGEENCYRINDRAMAQLTSDGWAITVTGYLTGNDSIFRNTSDALTDLGSLSGNGGSNPTVDAIQNWMIQTDVTNPILMGHSLGAMDVTVLYQRGFGSKLVLFSAPWVLPAGSLLPSSSEIVSGPRPVYVYSGTNDTISNMLPGFSGCGNYTDACRIGSGVNLIPVDTGGGFLSGNNPHDRCLYQPFYFVGRPCQW